jgi:outer membrane protein OmpA-like peptidoglycan-associated protein
MTRSEARTAEAWRGYDSAALIIALLGLLALLLLWWMGYGPTNAGCCAAPVVATAPAVQPMVPPPAPAPVAAPAPEPAKVDAPAVTAAAPTPEPAKTEPPKAAVPAVVPAVDCGKLVEGVSVQFVTGSAALTPEARAVLDRTLDCLKDGRYEVDGHTDNVGNSAANQKLSEARANAVVQYFRSKGFDAKRLTAVGFGETRPIADNATSDGRARNRRIAIMRMP